MHLIVPFAGVHSASGRQAMQTLALPRLQRLLARWRPIQTLGSDEMSLSPPHELALGKAFAWPLNDGAMPWAADLAQQAGWDHGGKAWALLTPVHLEAGSDQVTLREPSAVPLTDAESHQMVDALRNLFEEVGFGLHWLSAHQWLATHEMFDGLVTASIDRVAGRALDPWLPKQAAARPLRRLQNEVQMLLHNHPLNEAREAAGQVPINSFWCSGCGKLAARREPALAPLVDDRLRTPALREDWAAWVQAWQALDEGPITQLASSGQGQITLCGERLAQTWAPAPASLGQRLRSLWARADVNQLLDPL